MSDVCYSNFDATAHFRVGTQMCRLINSHKSRMLNSKRVSNVLLSCFFRIIIFDNHILFTTMLIRFSGGGTRLFLILDKQIMVIIIFENFDDLTAIVNRCYSYLEKVYTEILIKFKNRI